MERRAPHCPQERISLKGLKMLARMNFKLIAAVICGAPLLLSATDSLPAEDDFESGTLSGWTGDGQVTNIAPDYAYAATLGYPLTNSAHANVLWVEGAALRSYDDAPNASRTIDFLVMSESLPDDDLPEADGNEQFRLAFDGDGYINLYHHDNTNRWTKLSDTAYPSGTWVRVTMKIEYPGSDDARAMCQMIVDGSPCVTEYGYRKSDKADAGGSWYESATNGVKLAAIDFTGVGGVDDLVLAATESYIVPGGNSSTNGVDYSWLIDNGIAAEDVDKKVSPASAYTAKQSFDAGVDPYSSTPLYVTNATLSSGSIVLTINGFKGDSQSSYKVKTSSSPITPSSSGSDADSVTYSGDSSGNTTTATIPLPSGNVAYYQVVTTSGSVTTTNQFGLLRMDSAQTNTIVSAPWVSLGTNVENPGAMTVSKLVEPTNLTDGDKLILFNGTSYKAWTLSGGAWEPYTIVGEETTETIAGIKVTSNAEDTTLERGQGIWLVRQNPKDSSGNAKPFYIYGQYTSAPATTTVTANKTVLLANPNPATSFNFGSVNPGGSGADDKIIVTGDGVPKVYTYEDSSWGYEKTEVSNQNGLQVQTKERVENENTIAPAQGFWYKSSGGTPTINW